MLGRWDEALAIAEEFTEEQIHGGGVVLSLLDTGVAIHLARGNLDGAQRVLGTFAHLEQSSDVQDQSVYPSSRASLRRAEGRLQEALADGEATIAAASLIG
jgi:hypothetical protein